MRGPKRREIGHGLLAERALLPVVPAARGVPLHAAPRVRGAVVERLDVDGLGVRLDAVADGRRCADQGAGRRHRHGPRLRRGQVHDAHRHPRRRGRVRRHGLQGRRHGRVRHRAAARHQDRRHPRRRARRPLCSRPRRPASRSSRSCATPSPSPATRCGDDRAEDRQLRDPDRQDRRGHRAQGQGHQRHPAETGADISVDDDGMVGTVSIGSTDSGAVDEAERQIELILDPPTAEVGDVYEGKVVNITKFGAFVNILPGRDGLVHISKLGGGKRIDRVEDVLDLGDEHRGPGRRHRPQRQGLPDPARRARWRRRRRAAATRQRLASRATAATATATAATTPWPSSRPRSSPQPGRRAGAAPTPTATSRVRCPSRTRSRPSSRPSSATSARPRGTGRGAAAVAERRPRCVAARRRRALTALERSAATDAGADR